MGLGASHSHEVALLSVKRFDVEKQQHPSILPSHTPDRIRQFYSHCLKVDHGVTGGRFAIDTVACKAWFGQLVFGQQADWYNNYQTDKCINGPITF